MQKTRSRDNRRGHLKQSAMQKTHSRDNRRGQLKQSAMQKPVSNRRGQLKHSAMQKLRSSEVLKYNSQIYISQII